ncbi:hypothetical protein BH23CHL5_BH23CHL5_06360 [soil metagenome]
MMCSSPGASGRDAYVKAVVAAANWLSEVAQIGSSTQAFENPAAYPHRSFIGGFRTEYDTSTRRWWVNGPVFHAGQAIRALLVAAEVTGEGRFRASAIRAGEFIADECIEDVESPQQGLLMSLEQNEDEINIQVTVEALSGMLDLYEATEDGRYWSLLERNAEILVRDAYLPEHRLMHHHYSLTQQRFIGDVSSGYPGRAMVDDAFFLRMFRVSGNQDYRTVFLEMADRLIEIERPPGTWIDLPPWRAIEGRIHNRKNWWWGYPLLAAYDETGNSRYLECAVRAADWWLEGQTIDGGMYYSPGPDHSHTAYGLCTSVSAVAAMYCLELWNRIGESRFLEAAHRSLGYLLRAQFSEAEPALNVVGALYEAPNQPDGTTCPGFLVRDLPAIFAIRAWAMAMGTPAVLDLDSSSVECGMKW